MDRPRTLHFNLAFADRFDNPEIASSVARQLLALPSDFFPLIALHDDRRKRSKVNARDGARDIANALLYSRTAPDGIMEGVLELEKKGFPGLRERIHTPRYAGNCWRFDRFSPRMGSDIRMHSSEVRVWEHRARGGMGGQTHA